MIHDFDGTVSVGDAIVLKTGFATKQALELSIQTDAAVEVFAKPCSTIVPGSFDFEFRYRVDGNGEGLTIKSEGDVSRTCVTLRRLSGDKDV